MKITSLFSRISHGSTKSTTENNGDKTPIPDSKTFSSPASSPDLIPPSPVLEKKKAIKAKRSIIHLLVDDVIQTAKIAVSQKNSVPEKTIDVTTKNPNKSKANNCDINKLDFITKSPDKLKADGCDIDKLDFITKSSNKSKTDDCDVDKLDVITKSPDKSKADDNDVDYQSCIGTESMTSTICDETDYSDMIFDDWIDFNSSAPK